jgi:hypothetical protein
MFMTPNELLNATRNRQIEVDMPKLRQEIDDKFQEFANSACYRYLDNKVSIPPFYAYADSQAAETVLSELRAKGWKIEHTIHQCGIQHYLKISS